MTNSTLELAQKISHKIWGTYDDTCGYRTEKQERNAKVSTDNSENIWFFWNQFDSNNQELFYRLTVAEEPSNERNELLDWIVNNENI